MRAAMLPAIRMPMFFGASAESHQVEFAPSLKFNDARNSQYLAMRSIGVA